MSDRRALVEPGLSADAVARLERAREAWQSARPDETEVRAAVRRIARAGRARRRRHERWRGGALVTVGVLLLAALAYAATGGHGVLAAWLARPAPADAVANAHGAADAVANAHGAADAVANAHGAADAVANAHGAADAVATGARPPRGGATLARRSAHASAARAPASAARAPRAGNATGSAAPTAVPRRDDIPATAAADAPRDPAPRLAAASWAEVEDALAADDTPRAARALSTIARGAKDTATRAKARVGLAQLLAADGQCTRALRIALAVAHTPGVDPRIVAHALAATRRCNAAR